VVLKKTPRDRESRLRRGRVEPAHIERDAPDIMPVSYPIPGPLSSARFVRRQNRFLLQVRLEVTGRLADAHMADPGRLRELLLPGKRLWLRPAANPGRKTRWTAVLVESPSGEELVSLDTSPTTWSGRPFKKEPSRSSGDGC
jgi:hypothetical protein